jgi:hypothetical protein
MYVSVAASTVSRHGTPMAQSIRTTAYGSRLRRTSGGVDHVVEVVGDGLVPFSRGVLQVKAHHLEGTDTMSKAARTCLLHFQAASPSAGGFAAASAGGFAAASAGGRAARPSERRGSLGIHSRVSSRHHVDHSHNKLFAFNWGRCAWRFLGRLSNPKQFLASVALAIVAGACRHHGGRGCWSLSAGPGLGIDRAGSVTFARTRFIRGLRFECPPTTTRRFHAHRTERSPVCCHVRIMRVRDALRKTQKFSASGSTSSCQYGRQSMDTDRSATSIPFKM